MRPSRGLAAVLALPGLACMGGPPDPLVTRCSEVVEYRHPELRSLDIKLVRLSAASVALDFEGVNRETKEDFADRIECEFDPTGRMTLTRVALGGGPLSEAEVALANSELLLRDLSRDPEGS
jgi:hypothetical protein